MHADQERQRHAAFTPLGGDHHASPGFAVRGHARRRIRGHRRGGRDRRRQLRSVGQRHALRRRARQGLLQGGGPQHHGLDFVGRRRHVAAQHAGGRRRAVWRGQSRRRRLGDPGGRRPQDHQRQRPHRRRVRLGREARVVDQVDQGLQGQEDRLHEPALDEPGARPDAAAAGGLYGSRRRAREDRRLRRRHRGARLRPDRRGARSPSRCGRRSRASIARWWWRAKCCRRSTTSSA